MNSCHSVISDPDGILVYGFGETEKYAISDNDRHFKNIISESKIM